MKNDEQFDDLLRQKASSHEAPVPTDAWDNIIQKRKKRRFIFFWWCLAGVLIAGNAGYLIYKTQERNTDAIEIVQQNPSPTTANGEKETASNTENKKETEEAHNKKNDEVNKIEPPIADIREANVSNKKIVDNKAQKEIFTPVVKQKGVKEKNNKTNKNSTTPNIEKDLANKENITDNKAKSKQSEKNKGRAIQLLLTKKSESDKSNVFAGKNDAVVKDGKKKAGFEESEIPGEIVTETTNKTTSEKDAFTNTKQIIDAVVGEKKSQEKEVTIEVVKTIDNTKKVENLIQLDTSFSIGNIDSLEPLKIGLSNKKAMKNIAPISNSKWWVDVSATPFASISTSKTISQLNRTTQMAGYVAEYTANKVKISQEPGVVYAIALRKNVTKNWAFGLGFQYQQIKEKISMSGTETHTSTTVVQRLEQNSSGPILINDTITNVASGVRTIDALNSYTLMSVPIFAQYHLANKRSWLLDWNVGGFVNISRKYSNSVAGLFTGQNDNNKSGSSFKLGLDLFTELRISHPLTKKIFVFAAPGFRYNLSEYKMQGMFKYTFLHQAGLSLGLSIKL